MLDTRLSNNLLIQFGITPLSTPQTYTMTLPTSFTNNGYSIVVTDLAKNAAGVEYLGVSTNKTVSQFTIIGNLSTRNSGAYWHAIGY